MGLYYVHVHGFITDHECSQSMLGVNFEPTVSLTQGDRTAHILAAERGHIDCVRVLVGSGADLETSDSYEDDQVRHLQFNLPFEC